MAYSKSSIEQTIDNHIHVWSGNPSLAPLAEALRKNRHVLCNRLASDNALHITSNDALRAEIVRFALEQVHCGLDPVHFTLSRDAVTVQVILEDAFGVQPGVHRDVILIPHQNEAMKIIVRCLFNRRVQEADGKDVLAFVRLFAGKHGQGGIDQDRTMRFKTMVWFVYLAIDTVRTERAACIKGLEYVRRKLRRLLDCAISGTIIDEDSKLPGFEGGRWESTLFGWLQGEDRKLLAARLKRQINLDNVQDHANRYLLAEHRKCVLEQVLEFFC